MKKAAGIAIAAVAAAAAVTAGVLLWPRSAPATAPTPTAAGGSAQSAGGGTMTLSYSGTVTVDRERGRAQLHFANPEDATHAVVLTLYVGEVALGSTAVVSPGEQISEMTLDSALLAALGSGAHDGVLGAVPVEKSTGQRLPIEAKLTVNVEIIQ